jgi:hypothetical protein
MVAALAFGPIFVYIALGGAVLVAIARMVLGWAIGAS